MPRHDLDFVPQNVGPLTAPTLAPDAPLLNGSVQGMYVCLPKPLAGMGTNRQLQGIVSGLERMSRETGTAFGYIGPAIEGDHPLLGDPFSPIPATDSVADSYRAVTDAFTRAFDRLRETDIRRIAVLCMGYTAFGPEGIKRAIDACERDTGRAAPEEVCVLIIDSAYPDTPHKETAVDAAGWPVSRFYTPAFRGTDRVRTLFLLTSAYDYNAALLNARAPEGLSAVSVVAPPYTDSYLETLAADGRTGREAGIGDIAESLPGMSAFETADLMVPLVSSDIWSDSAVGVWMTEAEHHSCLQGTETIARALTRTARRLGRRIWMPIDTAGAEHLGRCRIDGATIAAAGRDVDRAADLILSPYRGLPQNAHTRLLGAADLAISRTGGQANATVVLGLAGTPNVIIDMPAEGYMQSELTSLCTTHAPTVTREGNVSCEPRSAPLAWRGRWHWTEERLAEMLHTALTDTAARDAVTDAAARAFRELTRSPIGNAFSIVGKLVRQ